MYEYLTETIQMRPNQGRQPGNRPGGQGPDFIDLGARLTALSADGWELVEIISMGPRPVVTILVRRPSPEPT